MVELIVAMGLSGLVILFVVSGTIFIQRYLDNWAKESKVAEEAIFVVNALSGAIEYSRRCELYSDSLISTSAIGKRTVYSWADKQLSRNGKLLTPVNMSVVRLNIRRTLLTKQAGENILIIENPEEPTGFYGITVVVKDNRGRFDSLNVIVENQLEYIKATTR